MSRVASMSGRRSTQAAAAKCPAWVHSAFGNDRSSRPRPMRSISESQEKYAMVELLRCMTGEARTNPAAGGGLRGEFAKEVDCQVRSLRRTRATPPERVAVVA